MIKYVLINNMNELLTNDLYKESYKKIGEDDVYIEDAGRDSVVKELKKRFAPVSLRGWKNIFHL